MENDVHNILYNFAQTMLTHVCLYFQFLVYLGLFASLSLQLQHKFFFREINAADRAEPVNKSSNISF